MHCWSDVGIYRYRYAQPIKFANGQRQQRSANRSHARNGNAIDTENMNAPQSYPYQHQHPRAKHKPRQSKLEAQRFRLASVRQTTCHSLHTIHVEAEMLTRKSKPQPQPQPAQHKHNATQTAGAIEFIFRFVSRQCFVQSQKSGLHSSHAREECQYKCANAPQQQIHTPQMHNNKCTKKNAHTKLPVNRVDPNVDLDALVTQKSQSGLGLDGFRQGKAKQK